MKHSKIVAHRGFSGKFPENTLLAFEQALLKIVDGIELDVHLCASGELVVIHDETVNRTTNGFGKVADLSLLEIKKLRVDRNLEIPTLEEVIRLVAKKCQINIELKGKNCYASVALVLENLIKNEGWTYKDFLISSFDWLQLEQLANLNASFQLGVLVSDNLEDAIQFSNKIKAFSIHPKYTLLDEISVQKIQQHSFKIYTWTVNDFQLQQQLNAWKIDAIITDFV